MIKMRTILIILLILLIISGSVMSCANSDKTSQKHEFEILFNSNQPSNSYNKIYTILDKSETNMYDYTIYAYDGSVDIRIDENEYSLREALMENKITMEKIIEKADKELDHSNILSYDDGRSIEYHYDNFTLIKFHNLNGNRDVYIGTKDMTINDLDD